MNILQMLLARRMQQRSFGQATPGVAASGCGCFSALITVVVLAVSGFFAYRVYDSSMNVVEDSMDEADEMVDDMLDDVSSGEVSGVGYEGTFECEAGGGDAGGALATLEITNTDTVAHTVDLTWNLFAVPSGFDDVDDLGDLTDPDNFDVPEASEMTELFEDTFTIEAGQEIERTYEAAEMTDENVGCTSPTLLVDMPGSVPTEPPATVEPAE